MNPTPSQRTTSLRIAYRCLKIGLIFYGLLLIALVVFEARLVYPGAFMDANLARGVPHDSPVQLVRYPSAKDEPLHGHLLERPGARGALLYLHGNGTRSAWLDHRIRRFAERFDLHVLAAEFRGFDESGRTPTEQSIIADALAARDYLSQRYGINPAEIVLYGRSLGGGVAAALAGDGRAKALILERTFDSLVDVAAGHYPYFPVRYLMSNRFDSVARLKGFKGSVIQIHGTVDQVIPIRHGRGLFDSLTTPSKRWIQVEGLGHNDWLPDPALDRIVAALGQTLGKPPVR